MNSLLNQRIQFLHAKLMQEPQKPLKPTVEHKLDANLPRDYRAFLIEIGSGEIGDMRFMIYPTPIEASAVYGSDIPLSLGRVLLFGDDFNGMCVGFDPENEWRIVEVNKHSYELEELANSFVDFVEDDWRLGNLLES